LTGEAISPRFRSVNEKFHFLAKIIRWTEKAYSVRGSAMDLETRARELIREERESDLRLSLRQIAVKTGVNHKRLWHFMSKTQPGRLTVAEVQAVYERLTGKPLLSNENDI
jgi:hypothetical protein